MRNQHHLRYLKAGGGDKADLTKIELSNVCGSKEIWEIEILSKALYVDITYDINKAKLLELAPLAVST